MLARKVVHEAYVAAEVIAGELQGNKAKVSPNCCLMTVPKPTATARSWAVAWSAPMRAT